MNKCRLSETDNVVNSLSEHIQSNAEYMDRLSLIISNALPHISDEIMCLRGEWVKINKEINSELEELNKIQGDL